MKKIMLLTLVAGMMSMVTSCSKCNTCSDSYQNVYNHDYCSDIYRTKKKMDEAKKTCEEYGGTWSAK